MRVVHCKKEKYTHYIGRPSVFGNPFSINRKATRQQVIDKYKRWIRTKPLILSVIKSLPTDAILGCWCSPEACHGAVIINTHARLHRGIKSNID